MCVSTSTVVTGTSIISDPIDSQLVHHTATATPILILLDQAIHPIQLKYVSALSPIEACAKYFWWKPHLSFWLNDAAHTQASVLKQDCNCRERPTAVVQTKLVNSPFLRGMQSKGRLCNKTTSSWASEQEIEQLIW